MFQIALFLDESKIENNYNKIAIIAGVGTRQYYMKYGYTVCDTYMVKDLTKLNLVIDNIINNKNIINNISIIVILFAIIIYKFV